MRADLGNLASALLRSTPIEVDDIVRLPVPCHAGPISKDFCPPEVPTKLTFRLISLAASIARTEALRAVSRGSLFLPGASAFVDTSLHIKNGSPFSLLPRFHEAADAKRKFFTGRVGTGIADLMMNQLGYTWRGNGEILASANDCRPDFIYDGGAVDGIVIAEASGSFAADKRIEYTTKRKYQRQVLPYLGKLVTGHGKIIHGYSMGFWSAPGCSGAELCIAEPQFASQQPATAGDPAAGNAPLQLALATFEANFLLLNATRILQWIRWVRDRKKRPTDFSQVEFGTFSFSDAEYVTLLDCEKKCGSSFAIFKRSCEIFLNKLTEMISDLEEDILPESAEPLRLPHVEILGFSSTEGPVRYRDGLAFFGRPFREAPEGKLIWSSRGGCRSE